MSHDAHISRDLVARCTLRYTAPDDVMVIDAAIREFAASGEVFSANDIREHLTGVHRPVIGGRFAAARRAGLIVPVGHESSTDPGTHAHPLRTWRGTRTSSEEPTP